MSLSEYIYTHFSIQILRVTLQTEGFIDSEASENFIFSTFTQTLKIKLLDLVSLRVMRADDSEISSAENEFFYSLSVAVNRKTLSLHLF